MALPRVVIDTNVLVSALRSNQGASFRLLSLLGSGCFITAVSVPIVIEYEAVLKREPEIFALEIQDIDDILDYFCSVSELRTVFYLWRPFLRDPKDDLVLELAVEAECDYVITFNQKDFAGIEAFGPTSLTPREFLVRIGEIA